MNSYCGLIVLAWAFPLLAHAETLVGRIVGVADGDTITILAPGNIRERIRVAGIDAPEKSQPYGHAAKQSLSQLVYDRWVEVDWTKRDRYGRIVGKVLVDGSDAGLGQLRAGMAWHYRKYESEQSVRDRTAYAEAESTARQRRSGLWADERPVAPWEWRRCSSPGTRCRRLRRRSIDDDFVQQISNT